MEIGSVDAELTYKSRAALHKTEPHENRVRRASDSTGAEINVYDDWLLTLTFLLSMVEMKHYEPQMFYVHYNIQTLQLQTHSKYGNNKFIKSQKNILQLQLNQQHSESVILSNVHKNTKMSLQLDRWILCSVYRPQYSTRCLLCRSGDELRDSTGWCNNARCTAVSSGSLVTCLNIAFWPFTIWMDPGLQSSETSVFHV